MVSSGSTGTRAKAGPMKLLLLGATGGIGRALIDQAIERGHTVTAFVRSPEKLGAARERLIPYKGDPHSVEELRAALPGHDAVISALGPPGAGPTTIHRDCARSTVAAMEATGVRRLLIVSAAVLFEGQGPLYWLLRNTFLRNIAEDTGGMERIVRATQLAWTIVRPPALNDGRLTGKYHIAEESMPRGGSRVPRADVAHFLLDECEQQRHLRHMVGMAGG